MTLGSWLIVSLPQVDAFTAEDIIRQIPRRVANSHIRKFRQPFMCDARGLVVDPHVGSPY